MSEDQFTKLFKYMQKEFGSLRKDMNKEFTGFRTNISHIYAVLDSLLKYQEADEQERLAMSLQLDRHREWIKQLAQNSQTELSPEP